MRRPLKLFLEELPLFDDPIPSWGLAPGDGEATARASRWLAPSFSQRDSGLQRPPTMRSQHSLNAADR
ncbi:unnamed protein product [Merluccius merluccius]